MTLHIVLGTGNSKKVVELRATLPSSGVRLSCLADFEDAIEVDETGATFIENARLKATQQARHLSQWVLADDSGLAVDALDGDPGIRSARYAGVQRDDAANNEKLLIAMKEIPSERRDASFICALCLSDPEGNPVIETDGACRGWIASDLQGRAGFGYDPLFVIREYHRTFAELDLTVKRAISHRAVAMRKMVTALRPIIESSSANNG